MSQTAALVDHAVPEEGLEAPEDRPDDLARGAGDGAVHQVDALLQRRFLGVLGVELHVGLRVVLDQPHLLAEQTAGCVDFLNRELTGLGHRRAVNVETAGLVEDTGDDDLVVVRVSLGRCRKTRGHQCRRAAHRALEQTSPSHVEHGFKPLSLFVERAPAAPRRRVGVRRLWCNARARHNASPPFSPGSWTAPPFGSRPGARPRRASTRAERTMRASTVDIATLFGPLLADRAPGCIVRSPRVPRDAGRDHG